ncbi:transposase [Rhizobium sp. EC-SD404]|uniref:transposase n=1 Tax=Rhizobium sp. EC-SD404 TaxID=2038389 RepID=UPI00336AAAEE
MPKAYTATSARFLDRFVSPDARIVSDADPAIRKTAKPFKGYASVVHGDDVFAQGDVHSNTAESVISTLNRAQIGVFHWLNREHQQRYR